MNSLDALTQTLANQPINPSWILSGQPQARSSAHSSGADGGGSTNVWDCTAGSFRWHFAWDETVLILEGGVSVTSPAGHRTSLKAGDVAYFPAGTAWTWEVENYVRKLAFHRRPSSRLDGIVQTMKGRLRSRAVRAWIVVGLATAAAAWVAVAQAYA
jgi:uncharacterized cupin superfamily protein